MSILKFSWVFLEFHNTGISMRNLPFSKGRISQWFVRSSRDNAQLSRTRRVRQLDHNRCPTRPHRLTAKCLHARTLVGHHRHLCKRPCHPHHRRRWIRDSVHSCSPNASVSTVVDIGHEEVSARPPPSECFGIFRWCRMRLFPSRLSNTSVQQIPCIYRASRRGWCAGTWSTPLDDLALE